MTHARLVHLGLGIFLALSASPVIGASAHAAPAPELLDPSERTAALSDVGRRLALVVGTSEHRAAATWPRLPNAAGDARALGAELDARYGFTVTILQDPRVSEFKAALASLAATAGPSDDLLVFVAGHGYFDAVDRAGYLAFADSGAQCESNCYPLDNIKRALYGTRARHVLVMLDVCHAGAIDVAATFQDAAVRAPGATGLPLRQVVRDYDRQVSRFILASVANAPTSDGPPGTHSPFMDGVLRVLADPGPSGVVSLDRLYVALAETQRLDVVRPMSFGAKLSPHPNGTFLFIEDVPMCLVLKTVSSAARDGFTTIRASGSQPDSTPWATISPASWLVPGARRCDIWTWQSDGHTEFRCDLGDVDVASAPREARALADTARACFESAPPVVESTRHRGAALHSELRVDWASTDRSLVVSTVCTASCALALVIQ